ncbi:SIP domain-containing protein [Gryllotalpicola daejeonensis]
MGSRHRKRPADRVFIAGDLADLAAIQHTLAVLPDDAYGQVFIEVLDERDEVALVAPPRVTVTWLARATRPSAMSALTFAAHGEALATAIAGWVGEWMPAAADPGESTVMWIGCAGSAHIAALYDVLQARLAGLNTLPDLSHHLS